MESPILVPAHAEAASLLSAQAHDKWGYEDLASSSSMQYPTELEIFTLYGSGADTTLQCAGLRTLLELPPWPVSEFYWVNFSCTTYTSINRAWNRWSPAAVKKIALQNVSGNRKCPMQSKVNSGAYLKLGALGFWWKIHQNSDDCASVYSLGFYIADFRDDIPGAVSDRYKKL
jgi:hypothetical protein